MRCICWLALLLPLLVLSACGETPVTRFATAQQQWQHTGIQSYRITVEYIANSPFVGPRTLEVRNDVIVSEPQACKTGMYTECVGPGENADRYTVPGLFGIIQSEMSRSDRTIIALEFDHTYGYPLVISTNTTNKSPTGQALPDLSYGWKVKAFVPIT